mgnify:CR=1 FL=1
MEALLLFALMVPGLFLFLRTWRGGREEYGSSADFLNWGALPAPGVVVCKDGSLLSGWEVSGLDTESLQPEVLNGILERFGRGLSNFADGDALWMRLDRRPFDEMDLPEGRDHLPALEFMSRDMQAQLLSDELYSNTLHLCWQHMPTEPDQAIGTQIEEFNRLADAAQSRLGSALKLRRLGTRHVERALGPDFATDELVDHLASTMSGRTRKLRQPEGAEHLYLDSLLAVGFEQSDLNELPIIDGRRCAVLSVEGLPAEYPDEVLAELEQINFEYAWVSRFVPQARSKTRATVKNLRRQWRQSAADVSAQIGGTSTGDRDVYADAMVSELDNITHDVGRPGVVYGSFSSTLMIFADEDTPDREFQAKIEAINSALQDAGFLMRIERHSALEVFLAALPGHAHRRPRDVYISGRNFADLMPLRTLWKGEEYCPSPLFPKCSPSLMLARTSTGELFRFNLHDKDVGHTVIFGPTTGGKSVLLGALATNFLKYNQAQVIFFDKQRSIERASHVFGGSFTSFGETEGQGLSPLSDTPRLGEQWARDWLEQMASLGGLTVTHNMRLAIGEAVSNMFAVGRFSLNEVCNFVADKDLRRVFEDQKGGILDTPGKGDQREDLAWADFTVFETHELFEGNQAQAILVLDYIFASVSKRFTGRPTLLVIDEAWAFMRHEIFAGRIRHWLKEARKSNVAVVLATQQLEDVVNSDLMQVMTENCKTKIFLPNAGAKTDEASNQYRALGLNTAQIDLVASLVPQQDYYLVKPSVARVVDFAFGDVTLSMIGKTSTAESAAAAKAFAKDPKYWMDDVAKILARSSSIEVPTNTLEERSDDISAM